MSLNITQYNKTGEVDDASMHIYLSKYITSHACSTKH